MTTTKNEIAAALAADNQFGSKAAAKNAVDAVFGMVADLLSDGETVHIGGLGKFEVKSTAARTGRNPSTGAVVQIAAGKKVAFKIASDLKAKL